MPSFLEVRLAEVILDVDQVLIVFLADIFLQLHAGSPRYVPRHRPRPRIRPRVINRCLVVQALFRRPGDSFYDVEKIRVRMSPKVEPRSFIETDGIYDEGIAFPTPGGVAQPSFAIDGVVRGMGTSVHKYFTPDMCAAFVDDEDTFLFGQLNDLRRERSTHRSRTARRKTKHFGIVLSLDQGIVIVAGRRPRLKRNEWLVSSAATSSPIEVFRCIGRVSRKVLNRWQTPYTLLTVIASQVYCAVSKPWCGLWRAIGDPAARGNRAGWIDNHCRPQSPDLRQNCSVRRNEENQNNPAFPHLGPPEIVGKV